jgi:hypothetical protein
MASLGHVLVHQKNPLKTQVTASVHMPLPQDGEILVHISKLVRYQGDEGTNKLDMDDGKKGRYLTGEQWEGERYGRTVWWWTM